MGSANESQNYIQIEKPLAVLNPKRGFCLIGLLVIVLLVPFFIFGVIIPVLMTGDFVSVWPVSDNRILYKAVLFFMACIYLFIFPFTFPSFRTGNCYFYEDRMEVMPFIGFKKLVFYYNYMYVNVNKNYRIVISKREFSSWRNPFQKYNEQIMYLLSVGINSSCLNNPSDVSHILNILERKSVSLKYTKTII